MGLNEIFEYIYEYSRITETTSDFLVRYINRIFKNIDTSKFKDVNALHDTYILEFSKIIRQLSNLKYETKIVDGNIIKIFNGENHLYTNDGTICDKKTFELQFLNCEFLSKIDILHKYSIEMLKIYLKEFDDTGFLILRE